jgi:pyridoxal phosphate enzyme (YggS family)
VNFDDEKSKSGIAPDHVAELAAYVTQLPHLRLRGLMLIPKPETNEQLQYLSFLRLTHLLDTLNRQLNIAMDTLSMGMSNDMQAAIRAGSTIVRIGTAIFGKRI